MVPTRNTLVGVLVIPVLRRLSLVLGVLRLTLSNRAGFDIAFFACWHMVPKFQLAIP